MLQLNGEAWRCEVSLNLPHRRGSTTRYRIASVLHRTVAQLNVMALLGIQVRPQGWEHSPPNERFELSDMDHWLPKLYTQMAEVFE